jgi:RNA polymerase sigma factor (sigma-70 family)
MDDFSVFQRIKDGDSSELLLIYKKYRIEFLRWAVKKYGCSVDEAKDIYQQTILIFFERITQNKLSFLTSKIKTYVFAIGKNLVLEHLVRTGRYTNDVDPDQAYEIFAQKEVDAEKEKNLELIEKSLEELGEPCRTLLISYYYQKRSMQEISDSLGYKNADTAKNLKYKCLKRLKKIFEDNS